MIVIKRNGSKEEFNSQKVEDAILKAFNACKYPYSAMDLHHIYKFCSNMEKEAMTPEMAVEDIQNKVEKFLCKKWFPVGKAYMLYREQHKMGRFIRERIDYMNEYSNSNHNASTSSETDSNANVTMKNVANLEGEVYKTTNRIIQRQRMKSKLQELYPEVADQYEKDLNSHIIYTHDEASTPVLKYYCCAVTLYPLMVEGVGNVDGITPTVPNDIQSFSGQITNLAFLLSSQCKGAVAFGDYFVALNYYVIKEFGEQWYNKLDVIVTNSHITKQHTIEYYILKGMKQFIYGVCQPAGNRSYNSPFTNVSWYDKYYFEAMFGEFYYPDGTKPEWNAVDKLQRMFMKLMREIRLLTPITFPVTTMSLLHNGKEFLDKDYEDLCAEEWSKGGSFFCYMNDNPASLASCCFTKDTICWFRLEKNSDNIELTFRDAYLKYGDREVFVYNPYRKDFQKAKLIRVEAAPRNEKVFKLEDCTEISCTEDHIFPVYEKGDLQAKDIGIGDSFITDGNAPIKILDSRSFKTNKAYYCFQFIDETELPYFTLTNGVITHNCRVLNEMTDNTFSSTTGMNGVMTGSCNVITLNINRIVQDYIHTWKNWEDHIVDGKCAFPFEWFSKNFSDLKHYLINILERVYKYHIAYKTMLYDLEDKGMFAASNGNYIYMKKLYSTIGLIGYMEAAQFLGLEISNNKDYKDFLKLIFNTVSEQNKLHSIHDKKRPFLMNSEAIPGENLGVKLLEWDKRDGYYTPEGAKRYSCYFFNPWNDKVSIIDKLKLHGGDIAKALSGGQAAHLNLDTHLSKEQYKELMHIAMKNGTNYFTFNIPMSKCKDCNHVVNAPIKECPKCHSKNIRYYTRIIGYLVAVDNWSEAMQKEFGDRYFSDLKHTGLE